jgi:hypothetical protein
MIDTCLDKIDELSDNKADALDEYAQECLQDKLWEGLLNPLMDSWWEKGDELIDYIDGFIDDMCYNKGPMYYVEWLCMVAGKRMDKIFEKGYEALEQFFEKSMHRIEKKGAFAEHDILAYYTELKNNMDCTEGDSFIAKLDAKVKHWADCIDAMVISDDKHMFVMAEMYRGRLIKVYEKFKMKLNAFRANLPNGLVEEEILMIHEKIDECIDQMDKKQDALADELDEKAQECYQPLLWEKLTNPLVDMLWVLGDRAIDQLDHIYGQMCFNNENGNGNGQAYARTVKATTKNVKAMNMQKWATARQAAKTARHN